MKRKSQVLFVFMLISLSLFTVGCPQPTDTGGGTPADTTPPSPVSDLQISSTTGQVTLTWTDPDDSDLDHIRITVEPSGLVVPLIVAAGTQQAVINGLTSGIPYVFNVQAEDTSGNLSVKRIRRETLIADLSALSGFQLDGNLITSYRSYSDISDFAAISGDYFLVLDSFFVNGRLSVFNIADDNSNRPAATATIIPSNDELEYGGIAVSGSWLYITLIDDMTGEGQLLVYDFSNLQNITKVREISLSDSGPVQVFGDTLIVFGDAQMSKFSLFDDHGFPNTLQTFGTQSSAVAYGDWLYAEIDGTITIYNMADPENVTVQGQITADNFITDMCVFGSSLLTLQESTVFDFIVYDLTTPSAPAVKSSHWLTDSYPDADSEYSSPVSVNGDLFLQRLDGDSLLHLDRIHLDSDSSGSVVGIYDNPVSWNISAWLFAEEEGDRIVFCNTWSGTLDIFDASVSSTLTNTNRISFSRLFDRDFFFNGSELFGKQLGFGTTIFSTDGNGGLQTSGSIAAESVPVWNLCLSGDTALVGHMKGLDILDVSDSSNPVLIDELYPGIPTYQLAFYREYAFCGIDQDRLAILDISDPASASEVASIPIADTTGYFNNVQIIDDYLLFQEGGGTESRMFIYSIVNPESPELIHQIDNFQYRSGYFARSGDYLYSFAFDSTSEPLVFILDMGDEQSITTHTASVGAYYPDTFIIYVSGSTMIGFEQYEGILIFDLTNPLNPAYSQTLPIYADNGEQIISLCISDGRFYAATSFGISTGTF